jgi:hypothetical protein
VPHLTSIWAFSTGRARKPRDHLAGAPSLSWRLYSLAFRLLLSIIAVASAQDGARLYDDHCTRCHDHDVLAPSREALSNLAPSRIREALETGSMKAVASQMTAQERQS